MLQDLLHSLTQFGREVLENEMWINLGNISNVRQIMSQFDVVQGENGRRAVGEMRDS